MREIDQDYPIARAYFTKPNWFPHRQNRKPSAWSTPRPAHNDELAGWIGHAAYWESRAVKAELEVERLQRVLSARRSTAVRQFSGITEVVST